MFLGNQTIVVLQGACGYDQYIAHREKWARQSEAGEAAVFNFSTDCVWVKRPKPARFEELCQVLLESEPGFMWVRSAGSTLERDQGRDLVAQWLRSPGLTERLNEGDENKPFHLRKVIVQVKTRNKTVGKSDVRDIRDTLERHDADKNSSWLRFPV